MNSIFDLNEFPVEGNGFSVTRKVIVMNYGGGVTVGNQYRLLTKDDLEGVCRYNDDFYAIRQKRGEPFSVGWQKEENLDLESSTQCLAEQKFDLAMAKLSEIGLEEPSKLVD